MCEKFNHLENVSKVNLFVNGEPMLDENFLNDYDVTNQSTIDYEIGLVGGKTHGRLANAGKVKKQTPHV